MVSGGGRGGLLLPLIHGQTVLYEVNCDNPMGAINSVRSRPTKNLNIHK